MAALRFCCSHADEALRSLLTAEGHAVRVGQLPNRNEVVLWSGPARIAQAWRRRGIPVVGGNSLDALPPLQPAMSDVVGTPVDVLTWANGYAVVPPYALMFREGDALLLKPTTSEEARRFTAPFEDALSISGHVGPFAASALVIDTALSPPFAMETRLPRGGLAGWLGLLEPGTAGEQLAEFAAGHLEKWELEPTWPMALVVNGRVAVGQVLVEMRDELQAPNALPSAEARFEMLSGLGWRIWEAQQMTREMTSPPAIRSFGDSPSSSGEHTQTGGFVSPTQPVNPSPTSPMSGASTSSPSPE